MGNCFTPSQPAEYPPAAPGTEAAARTAAQAEAKQPPGTPRGEAWDNSWPVAGRESELWIAAGINQELYDHIMSEFVSLDANGDRKLSRSEFQHAAALPEFLGMKPDDITHLFQTVDVNNSGDISFKEFLNYMSKRKDHRPLKIQVLPERERLERNMDLLGFELCVTDGGRVGVDGDGNCQFSSLSWKLHSTTSRNAAVRASVIEHLRGPECADFAAFYAPEHPSQPSTYDGYLKMMSRDRVWGDQLTLQAAADTFNLHVHVLTSTPFDGAAEPPAGQVSGRRFGAIETLVPRRPSPSARPREVWIAFAAQHYSPINPTDRTPKRLLTA